ncbi:ricin-type beta-trefoil lectin domain protein [Actinoplanes sp. NPDC051513]|uniref:ricin-type beta-trefoil lectin domain protein n=1 Tax=Actinoplanes sp. NPDC051513 TaxID=3363908 RepID=UPI00379A521F
MTDSHDDAATPDDAQPDDAQPDDAQPDDARPEDARPEDARPDPVLVRPYIGPVPDQPGRDPADAPTMVVPVIVDEPSPDPVPPPRRPRRGRGLALRLLALAGGVAVALAVAGWLIFAPPKDDTQPGAALPRFKATLPADPTDLASARASASHSPSPSPSSSSPSPSASASAPVSAPVSASAAAPSAGAATLAPPPASDRTGAVKAASGRCLALGGLLGLDGSPVQVTGCANLAVQRFTLASDGTLRVSGRCAQATGDGTVHIQQCGDAAAAQWRAGSANSLVNPSTGQCLTDPGQAGATTRVTSCTGASDQSWTLP